MTFLEFLKKKKSVDPEGADLSELMEKHYEEYLEFMQALKDGCDDKSRVEGKREKE